MRFVNANRPTEILVYVFRPRFRPQFLVGLNDLGEKKNLYMLLCEIKKSAANPFT